MPTPPPHPTISPVLALDFGGTKHTAALFIPGQTTFHAHRRIVSPPGADSHYDRQTVIAAARDLLGEESPVAVGVSFGGPVDFARGVVRLSHHVPGWEDVPLRALLEGEFGAPAAVDNDANAAALGEHRYGAGRGYADLLYVTVSTGVGGGWVLGGQVWRGADGMAGEIGHTVADPHGPPCLCGKRGCVERLASGRYIAGDVRARLATDQDASPLLWELCGGDLDAVSGAMVAEAASRGDALALGRMQQAAWGLGIGLGNAANLVNPQRVILGGGVAKSGAWFWEVVRRVARETALPEVRFDIVPAAFVDDAPLWGAVALALEAGYGQ